MARVLGYQVWATPIPQPTLEARDLRLEKERRDIAAHDLHAWGNIDVLEVAYAPALHDQQRLRRKQRATSITDLGHSEAPYVLFAPPSVGKPTVGTVKALSAVVANQDPQQSLSEAEVRKARPSIRHQNPSHTPAPHRRINVDGIDLANRPRAPSRRSRRREPADLAFFESDGRRRPVGADAIKGVPACTILGPQTVEIVISEQSSIRHLPRADVNPCHLRRILRSSISQRQHSTIVANDVVAP